MILNTCVRVHSILMHQVAMLLGNHEPPAVRIMDYIMCYKMCYNNDVVAVYKKLLFNHRYEGYRPCGAWCRIAS